MKSNYFQGILFALIFLSYTEDAEATLVLVARLAAAALGAIGPPAVPVIAANYGGTGQGNVQGNAQIQAALQAQAVAQAQATAQIQATLQVLARAQQEATLRGNSQIDVNAEAQATAQIQAALQALLEAQNRASLQVNLQAKENSEARAQLQAIMVALSQQQALLQTQSGGGVTHNVNFRPPGVTSDPVNPYGIFGIPTGTFPGGNVGTNFGSFGNIPYGVSVGTQGVPPGSGNQWGNLGITTGNNLGGSSGTDYLNTFGTNFATQPGNILTGGLGGNTGVSGSGYTISSGGANIQIPALGNFGLSRTDTGYTINPGNAEQPIHITS